MIFEKANSLLRYVKTIPELVTVDKVIASGVLLTQAVGPHKTENNNVYYMVQEYEPKEKSDDKFEFHEECMDVQVMIKGEEKCLYSSKCADFSLINKENGDAALVEALTDEEATLKEGMAVIYFPGELHKPGCKSKEGKCRKVVFKIRMV